MVLLEVSFYIQSSEKKTKFHSRIETPFEADGHAKASELKLYLLTWMADKNVITGTPAMPRLFVRLPTGDGPHTLADDDVIGHSRHLEVVYKAHGSIEKWQSEHDEITKRSFDASSSGDGLLPVAFVHPYQKDAEKTIFRVSPTMSVGAVLEKAKELFFQASCGSHPTFIMCAFPFGPPTGYNEDHLVQTSREDLQRAMTRVRQEAYDEGYADGMREAVRSSQTQADEPTPPQSGYTAIAGQAMKLGNENEEVFGNTADDKGKEIEEDYGNTADGEWETDEGMLFELNEKTSDDMKHCVINVNDKPFYKFYYQKGDRFNVLFTTLDQTGLKTNHLYNENADFVLGFSNSFAHEHDLIERWGSDGACFILTDRKEQLAKMASSSFNHTPWEPIKQGTHSKH